MSLHTKYRPTSLDQVLGQGKIARDLEAVMSRGLAKSFLFTEPSGCGKTTIARILANRFAGGEATQANIEEINAANLSGADAMRSLLDRSQYRAIGKSPIKTLILDEVHSISATAFRVLLKPIEEPPTHVRWILCTTDPAKIPNTIITRCLRFDLKPVTEEDLFELLDRVSQAESLGCNDGVLEAITESANGSPRQALVNLEKCAACTTVDEVAATLRKAVQNKTVIDFCRWLVNGQAQSWAEAMKYVNDLDDIDPESIRINVVNYLSAVAANSKTNAQAKKVLELIEPFAQPYNSSDKQAPLLLSIGFVLGLDRS